MAWLATSTSCWWWSALVIFLSLLETVSAATDDDENSELFRTLLIVLIICLVVIVLIIVVVMCCFQEWIENICSCVVAKVTPEDKSYLHNVDKFGETRIKSVSYNMGEVLGTDKESVVSERTNISLQVPIFEEMLNANVVKKSVHVAIHEEENEEKRKKKSKRENRSHRRRREEVEVEGGSLPPLRNQPPSTNSQA